ncbi:MAG: calcium-binding protein, partial [Cycloclasticus sp.]
NGSGSLNKTDRIEIGEGINEEQLWLSQQGDDLQIDVIGSDDQIRIENWYKGEQYRIEEIELSGGAVLLEHQVEQLVSAMASFNVSSSSDMVLQAAVEDELKPLIAVSWQHTSP